MVRRTDSLERLKLLQSLAGSCGEVRLTSQEAGDLIVLLEEAFAALMEQSVVLDLHKQSEWDRLVQSGKLVAAQYVARRLAAEFQERLAKAERHVEHLVDDYIQDFIMDNVRQGPDGLYTHNSTVTGEWLFESLGLEHPCTHEALGNAIMRLRAVPEEAVDQHTEV